MNLRTQLYIPPSYVYEYVYMLYMYELNLHYLCKWILNSWTICTFINKKVSIHMGTFCSINLTPKTFTQTKNNNKKMFAQSNRHHWQKTNKQNEQVRVRKIVYCSNKSEIIYIRISVFRSDLFICCCLCCSFLFLFFFSSSVCS